ncbi:alpha/beta hydrolase [Actinopolymorpha sp. B11F2]|uniref:alpha/beta hydrolase n=1 Tax=Actinopolymorpha sp. B11F2 TaxID=3160862 RepID=UPI0032E4114C
MQVDDADPGRGFLDVAMIRVRPADQHDRIGSLVLNPAGAGLSVWATWGVGFVASRGGLVSRQGPESDRSGPLGATGVEGNDIEAGQQGVGTPHPVLPIPETITASPVLVIATEADPATSYYGGVALARALGPRANLLTVSGGGHTALERSPCVAQQVTLYLVEVGVPGGQAC